MGMTEGKAVTLGDESSQAEVTNVTSAPAWWLLKLALCREGSGRCRICRKLVLTTRFGLVAEEKREQHRDRV